MHLHAHIYCRSTSDGKVLDMSVNRWMDNSNMVHSIYITEFHSFPKKNKDFRKINEPEKYAT